MGHLTRQKSHRILRDQLDRYPMGAPGSNLIMEILETIYTAEEAELAAAIPLGFTNIQDISQSLHIPVSVLQSKLDSLADKGLVLDLDVGGEVKYCLPPTLVGLFEFSMMRMRDDFDQKKLAELFHRYLVAEPEYFLQLKGSATTPFRTMIHEETIPADYSEVLDYERATEIIKNESYVAAGICHCRHVAHHLGRDCSVFKMESCLSFGSIGDYLVRHKFAVQIEQSAALDMLAEAKFKGMVHIGDNVQNEPNFLCNCCSCCCEVLNSFKNFDFFANTFSSNFEAVVNETECNGCQKCITACPVEAIDQVDSGQLKSEGRKSKIARVDKDTCIGCGVCVPSCTKGALKMKPRPKRHIVPENTIARTLMMAVERGTLKKLIADQHSTMSTKAIGAVLGAISTLPPGKQLLARDAIKSRFVDFLVSKG